MTSPDVDPDLGVSVSDPYVRWRTEPAQSKAGWEDFTNCTGIDPDQFFPERGYSPVLAKEVCRGCVVKEECLEAAINNDEQFGVYGGMTANERRRLRISRIRQNLLILADQRPELQ